MSTFYQTGRYRCEVTQQGMTKAGTGTPQFVIVVRVLDIYVGPDSIEPMDRNYERTIYRAITEKTIPYLQKELDALGFPGGSLRTLDPKNGEFHDFRGVQVDCICKHEPGKDGELRERWSIAWAHDATEIQGEELAASDYRALDALFGKASGKPAAKAAPKPAAAAPVGVDDDDVPF